MHKIIYPNNTDKDFVGSFHVNTSVIISNVSTTGPNLAINPKKFFCVVTKLSGVGMTDFFNSAEERAVEAMRS